MRLASIAGIFGINIEVNKAADPFMTLSDHKNPPATPADSQILAIDAKALLGPGGPMPMVGVAHHSFGCLDAALLARLQPTLVVFPLFAAGHDAISVIEILEKLVYLGRISVIAPALPRPKLVERELRALGPEERLTLITL